MSSLRPYRGLDLRLPLQRASALLLTLALAACASQPPPPEPAASSEERRAFEKAQALVSTDPDAATESLQAVIEQWPRGPLADDAGLALADIALAEGETEQAIQRLSRVTRDHPRGDKADAARLRLARLYLEGDDAQAARRQLARVRVSALDPDSRREAYRLRAVASELPVERVRWTAALRDTSLQAGDAPAVAAADREIDAVLDGMSADELERVEEQLDGRIPAGRVRLRLAERALQAGDFSAAEKQLSRAERLALAPEYEDLREQLRTHVELRRQIAKDDQLPGFSEVASLPPPRSEGARGTIGVVLPLTGPFADYGEESLRGVLLAARIFDETGSVLAADGPGVAAAPASTPAERVTASGVRVLVRDSRGDPEVAAAAVRELARDDSVSAVIGPLLSGESDAAALAAEAESLPLVALTAREDVARRGENVFRLRTTPHDEVRYLVDHAVAQLGATRFAILYPRDNYGRGMRKYFWDAVESRGARVVAVSSYEPDATDYAKAIRRMIGYELLTPAEQKALRDREEVLRKARRLEPTEAAKAREKAYAKPGPTGDPLPPIVDFDALFIPDDHENVVLIAPQLAFHEVTGVQLLGSGAWLHPDLVKIDRGHVKGAVISAPFHAQSGFVFVSQFVERYTETFQRTPDTFAAHGFDAANLVLVQLANGRDSRRAVRRGLLRTETFPGVSGVTRILPDGNARKRPYLLAVGRGKIEPLD